jgi:hypothetical protein
MEYTTMDITKYITVEQAAAQLNVSAVYVRKRCQRGHIPGAVKKSAAWLLPISSLSYVRRARGPRKRKATSQTPL